MPRMLRRKNDWSAYLFIAPAMLVLALFLFYPMLWTLIASFQDVRPLRMRRRDFFDPVGDWVGARNYFAVLRDGLVRLSAANTLRFALFFVPSTLFGSSCSPSLSINRAKASPSRGPSFSFPT
jgi:ABC-type sugar transport system permease subunit